MSQKTSLCQGIDDDVHYKNFQWEEAEIQKLGHHPVSEPLRAEYRRAAEDLRSLHPFGYLDFSRQVKEGTFWGTYMTSTFQWETIFVQLLTDPTSPVQFDPIKSLIGETTPAVWVPRIGLEPIKIMFVSPTDLPIPSPEADRLMEFINSRLENEGIHLPRKFKIERGDQWPDESYRRYEIFIPKGECNKPEDQDVS